MILRLMDQTQANAMVNQGAWSMRINMSRERARVVAAQRDNPAVVKLQKGEDELWGFPWVENEETRRWYSKVILADGALNILSISER